MFWHPRSILLIHSGGLGDLILSLPAVKRLRERFPNAQVRFLGILPFLKILDHRYYADGIYSLDRSDMASLFSPSPYDVEPIKPFFKQYDSVISWCEDGKGYLRRNLHALGIRSLLISSPIRKLRNLKKLKDEKPFPLHASDVFMDSLSPVGIHCVRPITEIYLLEGDNVQAEALFISRKIMPCDHGYAVFHIGGGNVQKRWPLNCFLELAAWLKERKGILPIFLTGPAEENDLKNMTSFFRVFSLNHFHCMDLPILGALIQKAIFFVGNDSGISHLASATGTTTFVIFGVTDPSIWKPVGKDVRVIGPCRGPKNDDLENGTLEKKTWPNIEDVQREIEQFLKERYGSQSSLTFGTKPKKLA